MVGAKEADLLRIAMSVFYFLLFYVYGCFLHVSMCAMHVPGACGGPEEGVGAPQNSNYSYEMPCRCWDSNSCPLKEWQVLLPAEPSVQLQIPASSFTMRNWLEQIPCL